MAERGGAALAMDRAAARTGRAPWPGQIATSLKAAEPVALGVFGVAVILSAWQLVAQSGILSPLIFSPPSAAVGALRDLAASGEIVPHLSASIQLLLLGLGIAVPAAIVVGYAAGWFSTVRGVLNPWVALLYSTPSIAIMPLFIVWFGLGLASQLPAVVLLAFFPSFYAAVDGVRTADRNLLRVSRSFGASDRKLFRSIVLPGSVPLLLSGLRLSLGKGIIGVIAVELYAGDVGLGNLLNVSAVNFRTDRVFAVIAILVLVGLLSSVLFRLAERHFDRWRPRA